jgi:hypothetical protein
MQCGYIKWRLATYSSTSGVHAGYNFNNISFSLTHISIFTVLSAPFISIDRAVAAPALCNISCQDYLLGDLRTPRPAT